MKDTKGKDRPFKVPSPREEMGLAFHYVEGISNPNGNRYPPTIDEMRRVARYLSQDMGQYSTAGKLFVRADILERAVEDYLKARKDCEENKQ